PNFKRAWPPTKTTARTSKRSWPRFSMFSIWTKNTGKTPPNVKLHWHDSKNLRGCLFAMKERSNENLSHRLYARTRRQHRLNWRPGGILVAFANWQNFAKPIV